MKIQVEEWQLDTETREVWGPEGRVRLRPQIFRTFCFLIERAPAVVSKGELLEGVWESQAVSDSAIAQVVRELRSILGDDPSSPRIIATRHRQGYQLIAEVRPLTSAPASRPESLAEVEAEGASRLVTVESAPYPDTVKSRAAPRLSKLRWRSLGAGLVAVLTSLVALAVGLRTKDPPPISAAGWPLDPRTAAHLERGLYAARSLDSASALEAFQAALALAESPRLEAQVARLWTRKGRAREAEAVLDRLRRRREDTERRDQLFADAVRAELEGRLAEAARLFALLAETHPEDLDFALAWWETDNEADADRLQGLMDRERTPIERRLLILAQDAGRKHQPEEQLDRAELTIRSTERSAPVIAALAQIEKGHALRSLGQPEESVVAFSAAAATLQALGEVRAASRALGFAVNSSATLWRIEELSRLLASYEELLEGVEDPLEQARLPIYQGRLASIGGDHTTAAEFYALAAERCESLAAWGLGATALGNRSDVLQKLGRLAAAEVELQKAIRWSEASQVPNLIGQASLNLANYASRRGDLPRAASYYERALTQFRQAKFARGEAAALVNLAHLARLRGMTERAIEWNGAAGRLFREMGLAREEAISLFQSAETRLTLGDLDATRNLASKALELLRPLRAKNFEAASLALLAHVELRAAELDEAAAMLAPDKVPETQSAEARARVQIERARQARERGDRSAARAFLLETLGSVDDPDDTAFALPCQLELARLELDEARPVVAEQMARKISGIAERGQQASLERDAALLVAEALFAQGKLEPALERLEAARSSLEAAPDFQSRLAYALVEAQIESAFQDRETPAGGEVQLRASANSRERLRWILNTAEERGHRLIALETRVELACRFATRRPDLADLARELEERGLIRLLHRLRARRQNLE